MSETVLCEKCGAEMRPVNSENTIGMICPNCGWGWATTILDPITEDETIYSVILTSSNRVCKSTIKTVAKIIGSNYLQAKKMIEKAPAKLLVGKATSIKDALKTLLDSEIQFLVEPPFPYSLTSKEHNP